MQEQICNINCGMFLNRTSDLKMYETPTYELSKKDGVYRRQRKGELPATPELITEIPAPPPKQSQPRYILELTPRSAPRNGEPIIIGVPRRRNSVERVRVDVVGRSRNNSAESVTSLNSPLMTGVGGTAGDIGIHLHKKPRSTVSTPPGTPLHEGSPIEEAPHVDVIVVPSARAAFLMRLKGLDPISFILGVGTAAGSYYFRDPLINIVAALVVLGVIGAVLGSVISAILWHFGILQIRDIKRFLGMVDAVVDAVAEEIDLDDSQQLDDDDIDAIQNARVNMRQYKHELQDPPRRAEAYWESTQERDFERPRERRSQPYKDRGYPRPEDPRDAFIQNAPDSRIPLLERSNTSPLSFGAPPEVRQPLNRSQSGRNPLSQYTRRIANEGMEVKSKLAPYVPVARGPRISPNLEMIERQEKEIQERDRQERERQEKDRQERDRQERYERLARDQYERQEMERREIERHNRHRKSNKPKLARLAPSAKDQLPFINQIGLVNSVPRHEENGLVANTYKSFVGGAFRDDEE